ncbi:MAG: FKBP-type peptidyl-prolyl cis-trans isomerase [Ferruginibacter sp.]
MRNKLFFMLALPLIFAACKKSNECPYTMTTTVAPAAEVANLKMYLDTNALPYTQHPSGIFYQVITPGSGAVPGVCSNLTVKYKGQLTNGAGFDSSYQRFPDGIAFTLGELIPGWQIGIPLIQKGGSIILYIPPTLGYGSRGNGPLVPGNSNLVFKIDLLNVQ